MFKYNNYLIETITDTHAGSGDSSAVADSTIQKDLVTNFPIFRNSSLKGAIKDHMRQYKKEINELPPESSSIKRSTFEMVFGPDVKTASESSSPYPNEGLVKFFDASIITIPLRASRRVFYNSTCPMAVTEYLNSLLLFNCVNETEKNDIKNLAAFFTNLADELNPKGDYDFIVFDCDAQGLMIEEFENGRYLGLQQGQEQDGTDLFTNIDIETLGNTADKFLSFTGSGSNILSSVAVFSDEVFSGICDSWLPVKSRNCVEKGNENLFYEEVLPRKSLLWFMTGEFCHFSNEDKKWFETGFSFFNKKLTNDLIQIGGNASIGQGVINIGQTKQTGDAA